MEVESDDRISGLPQDIIENILTLMPLKDALRTSILSTRWRFCWRTIPKLAFDFRSSSSSSFYNTVNDKYMLLKSIFHVLLLHRAPILEFSLDLDVEIYSEMDVILLHLCQSQRSNTIKKFSLEILGPNSYYSLPSSLFELQGLEHMDLSYCKFESPLLLNKGFSKLKSLCFQSCDITTEMLFGFLTKCPLLEKFTWYIDDIWSFFLTECQLVELFECLPSLRVLEFHMLNIKPTAGHMPHKLPISLIHLRVLVLNACFLELPSIICLIASSPNLKKVKLQMDWHDYWLNDRLTSGDFVSIEEYTDLKFDRMKEMKITGFREHGSWMEFVKVVMARSPMLKKATIEFYTRDPADKQVEMLKDFPRASPAAKLVIKPKKDYD